MAPPQVRTIRNRRQALQSLTAAAASPLAAAQTAARRGLPPVKITDVELLHDIHERTSPNQGHGPGNVSPIGHAVNLHLDLASFNFGIQEQNVFSDTTREVFPGAPEIKGGYLYANDRPGLGIDIDERVAARFPYKTPGGSRGNDRRLDGTIVRP